MMMRLGTILLVAGLAATVWANDPLDDRKLLEQAAAQRPTPQTQQAPGALAEAAQPDSDDTSEAERAARAEANLALAKLELVLGRKALRAEEYKDAARKAHHALVLLRQLPPDVDADEYELQAEGILGRAAEAGVDVAALAYDAAETAPLREEDVELDRRVQAAARIVRQYNGPPRADIDSSGDARALRERTLRRQMPDRHGYRPGREIIDVGAIVARDEQGLPYQGALREAYRADEVRMLIEADEARLIPSGVISYPRDWPERMRRREKYAGGMIARSPSWHDKDGREWYVAIYDIHDLIYVPPQFDIGYGYGDGGTLRDTLDRQALRDYSFIFRGMPEDLAAGIPLLRYFGGVNTYAGAPAQFDLDRQREIVEMIRAFTGGRVDEALTLPLQPAPESEPAPEPRP